jgi:hypothetical protein
LRAIAQPNFGKVGIANRNMVKTNQSDTPQPPVGAKHSRQNVGISCNCYLRECFAPTTLNDIIDLRAIAQPNFGKVGIANRNMVKTNQSDTPQPPVGAKHSRQRI